MSHSCRSNLQHEYSETSGAMVLHAQRTIEPGEELTIRYIDTIQGMYVDPVTFFKQLSIIQNRKMLKA